MQRGIISLTREQLTALKKKLDEYGNNDELFYGKFDEASINIKDNNEIFLSEDEVEKILDIVGIEGDETFKGAVNALNDYLRNLRNT